MTLNKFLNFLRFTEQFRSTKRGILAVNENRNENDIEHSYQLAIITWYVIETEKLKLNSNLAIKYALIHDLEESLYGDIHIFDEKGRTEKELKESEARKKIVKMFPKWNEYEKLSNSYKLLKDEESRLVNGLDKILPVLNIYLDSGKTWKQERMTLTKIFDNKRKTVTVHAFSKKLWRAIENLLKRNESKLFPNTKQRLVLASSKAKV